MKPLFFSLLATLVVTALCAQTVTLTFVKNHNYQVVIDGVTYKSSEAVLNGNNKMMTMNNLTPGSHTLEVYPVDVSPTSGTAIYKDTFALREGYDVDISVKANGQVSITEKGNQQSAVSTSNYEAAMAMNNADFNHLSQSVKNKWPQSARVNALRNAFHDTTRYFTTDQIGQLLSLVHAEPTQLQLAKEAYVRVVDPANYHSLNELFSNESLRTELDFFLRNTTIVPAATVNAGNISNAPADTNTNTHTNSDVEATAPAKVETAPTKVDSSLSSSNTYAAKSTVSNKSFSQLQRKLKKQRAQQDKVETLATTFQKPGNYYSTEQLRQLLTPIDAEADRLTLAKLAYTHAADTAQFTSLYDLLNDPYSRMELNHFIRYGNVGTTVTTGATGKYANRVAISDADFSQLDLKVGFQSNQSNRVAEIKKAFNGNNYFTAEQIRQWLNMVTAETDRLELAKLAYLRITDPGTFSSLYDLFSDQDNRNELERYAADNKF